MPRPPDPHPVRGQSAKAQSAAVLTAVIRDTARVFRKHHLSYDQSKYVLEQARRQLALEPPRSRRRTVERLDRGEVECLIAAAYRDHSPYGLMIKTLFLTGARVDELVHTCPSNARHTREPCTQPRS